MTIGIIGYGVVGQNMHKLFPDAYIVDPVIGGGISFNGKDIVDKPGGRHYDVAFVCVPTDMLPDGSADTRIVKQAVLENEADLFVIKSTVPPGTTDQLNERNYGLCCFSPEFFGETQHANAVDYDFVILGGSREATDKVAELYKSIKSAVFHIRKTDAKTAELVKYAENCFLATKVTFFNEFFRLCIAAGIDPDEWRELLLLDPRIGRSHSFTYREHPWYASHCLDKDIPALTAWASTIGVPSPMMVAIQLVNAQHKADFTGGRVDIFSGTVSSSNVEVNCQKGEKNGSCT